MSLLQRFSLNFICIVFIDLFSLSTLSLAQSPLVPTGIQTYTEEVERDIPLKKQAPLYIQHLLGNVSVQGWVQDRIRIKMKKRILSSNEALAKTELQKVDLVTLDTSQSFELRVGHTRGADLVTKMRDQKQNQVVVDLEIKAPYQLDLTMVLADGKEFQLQQWKGAFFLNGKNNSLKLSRLNLSKPMKVNCQNCDVELTDSKVAGHILIGSKLASLRAVESSSLMIDTSSGEVRLDRTEGHIHVHTSTGRLSSNAHHGTLNFQSDEGGLFVSALNGNAEAHTVSGQMMIEAEEVKDFLHLDTEKSDIQVSLPPKFEGALDLLSLRGEVVVQFPYEQNATLISESYGPASLGRVNGTVAGSTHTMIHAYSKQGGVRILRKVPKR